MTVMKTSLKRLVVFSLSVIAIALLFGYRSCSAKVQAQGLTDTQLDRFSANNIFFYNPGECMNKVSDINANSCFRISNSTSAKDFWYPEGCINNGECESGIYAKVAYTNTDEKDNDTLVSETKSDDEMGGLQYIYAENYDIEFNSIDGWITRFTKNGGNSTRKYYWVALPEQAYSTGFGETYVATFENLSEPIYFITYDVHACEHQLSESGIDYCTEAENDPEGVEFGLNSIGAFSKYGGGYDDFVDKAGKIKTLCRINGKGEVTAHEYGSAQEPSSEDSSSSSKDSDTEESGTFTVSASTNKDNEGDSKSSDSSNNSTSVVGNVHEASDSIPCANGTKDLGVTEEAYYDGNKITIRLCSIPNISSTSSTDTDGNIHVNSRASGAYYALGKKYNELYGGNLSASQSFRTMEQQQYFWDCYQTGGCNDGNLAAQPGHSNHQLGTAVDFNMGGSGWGDTGVSGFFNEYLSKYGLARNVSSEDWHVSHASDTNPDDLGGANSDSDCTSYEGDFPQYYQGNYEASDHENSTLDWTTMLYGRSPSSPEYKYKTVAETGCGLVSMAMLATALTGKDIYPQDIADITKDAGYYNLIDKPYSKLDTLVGAEYGLEVIEESYSSKDDAYTKIKDYLNKGYMIHLSGEGAHTGFSRSNTDGHYVGIFKIDSQDNVWVANSNSVGNSTVPLQNIIDAIHAGEFGAIRKSGSGSGSSCFDYCDNSGSNGSESVGEEGLTVEQAKTFMMNYGENKNDSSKNAVGSAQWGTCNGGGSNCVTFSAFFISKFTTIGAPSDGLWGDGQELVSYLKNRSSVEATFGTDPKVYAIVSTPVQHTAVVLGHHDGKWIVGHASCKNSGVGKGNGGNGNINSEADRGDGSGFIAIEESDDPSQWQWVESGYSFAYPNSVDTKAISEYLTNGT